MISTLVAIPYEIARLPLTVVDSTLADRLPETSAPRVTFDRALGSADRIAGRLTGNRSLARRGAERLDRLEKRVAAVRLEQEASAKRDRAGETVREGRQEAAQKREQAQDRLASAPAKAEAAELRLKKQAKERARGTATVQKVSADERAVKVVETAEQQEKRRKAAADARKKAAQRRAQAKAEAAREIEESAEEKRAEAERLEDLAETRKQERKGD